MQTKTAMTPTPGFLLKHTKLQVTMLLLLNNIQDSATKFHLQAAK